MIKKKAFANSVAVIAGLVYLGFYFLNLILPRVFGYLFNAQFLGANVASLFPQDFSLGHFIGSFVVLVLSVWVSGFCWAWLYNRFSR